MSPSGDLFTKNALYQPIFKPKKKNFLFSSPNPTATYVLQFEQNKSIVYDITNFEYQNNKMQHRTLHFVKRKVEQEQRPNIKYLDARAALVQQHMEY